ncbi:MAG: RNA 2',3'-cyclic phosphodiesterase [Verrucomicrobia bacterium]|nr:RNA 2',3'-cyclic phosphodiesterase [Verrucomicrobiota bacterium]
MNPEGQAPSVRAFVSISPEAELIAELRKLQETVAPDCERRLVKWTRPDQIHLTLRFLGNVRAEQVNPLSEALRRACEPFQPFEIRVDQIGCFPSPRRPSVIWVGIAGDLNQLQKLQEAVQHATEPFARHSENRAFHPHLTIGRVKARGGDWGSGDWIRQAQVTSNGKWSVTEVKLMQSKLGPEGSTYTALLTALLARSKD